ncbi:unnamed protein product [Ectocarpus sp. CCAP 1310/34]|nr:unnamed protein product [Ectocarpus sp. CCAP 1310/34]
MTIYYIEPVEPAHLAGARHFAEGALFSAWENIACVKDPATGLTEIDLSRVVCVARSRTCEDLRSADLPGLSSGLFRMFCNESMPDLLMGIMYQEHLAGTAAKESEAEILLRTKHALVDATAKYLFTCPAKAGMLHTATLFILPVFFLDSPSPTQPPARAQRADEGDETRSQAASSVVSSAKRAREEELEPDLASLLQAIEGEDKQQPAATSGKAPAKKKLLTSVSIGTQVRNGRMLWGPTLY